VGRDAGIIAFGWWRDGGFELGLFERLSMAQKIEIAFDLVKFRVGLWLWIPRR
jgi:hypothetical protein